MLKKNTLVRIKHDLILRYHIGSASGAEKQNETVQAGTYGLIRYFSEGKYGVLWLRPEGATVIEVRASNLDVQVHLPKAFKDLEQIIHPEGART